MVDYKLRLFIYIEYVGIYQSHIFALPVWIVGIDGKKW